MKISIPTASIKQVLFSPAAYSVGATFALQGFSLLGFMLLARLLTLQEMGNWAIWLTLVSIADLARQGLIRNGLIHFTAGQEKGNEQWQSAALLLNVGAAFILGSFLSCAVMSYAFFSKQISLLSLAWWALPFCLLQGVGRFAETLQVARSDFKGIFWANLLNGTLQLSLIFLLFVKHKTPALVQLAGFQALGIAVAFLFTLFFRKKYFRFGTLEKQKCLELFHFGKYVAGTNFFSILFQRLDTLLVSVFLTPAAVAIYNVATRLNGLLDLPLNGFSQALYPRMASDITQHVPAKEVYGKGVRQLLMVQTILSLLVVFTAPELVKVLTGPTYLDAVPLVRILALAGMVKPWGRTFGLLLDATGNTAFNFKMLLLSFGVNLLFGLTLLPVFGLLGAALATGLGVVVTTSLGQYFLKKLMAIRPWYVSVEIN